MNVFFTSTASVNEDAHRWKQVKWTNTFTIGATGSGQAILLENRIPWSHMLLVVVAWFAMEVLVAEIPMLVCMEHPHKKMVCS
jgi:hypothetical protein